MIYYIFIDSISVWFNRFIFIIGVGVTLGSAVTASMNLTNSTEALEPSGQVPYKTESSTDMHLYYQVLNYIVIFDPEIRLIF